MGPKRRLAEKKFVDLVLAYLKKKSPEERDRIIARMELLAAKYRDRQPKHWSDY
jgi:hypothetical protein